MGGKTDSICYCDLGDGGGFLAYVIGAARPASRYDLHLAGTDDLP